MSDHHYKMQSHELRITSPKEWPLRFIGGLFYERQAQNITQDYLIKGLSPVLAVTGWPDMTFLTRLRRLDRDSAAFGEVSYDITTALTATAGLRVFKAETRINGFFGQSLAFDKLFGYTLGQAGCFGPPVDWAPCTDLNNTVSETGHT